MKYILLAILFVVSVSCSLIENQSLPPQESVDLIRVRQNSSQKELATLSDERKVEAVVSFINTKLEGWSVPWAGAPVGQVYVDLYKNDIFAGNFYVGPNYFGRDVGDWFSRTTSKAEIKQLGALLGINLLELVSLSK